MNQKQIDLRNQERMALMHPAMARKVAAIIQDLKKAGWLPIIDHQVWRSKEQQAKLKAEGKSKVSYSFHNVSSKNGNPESLAADITDYRYGWDSPTRFWLMLRASANAHGCTTGMTWGLKKAQKAAIESAIAARNWSAKVSIGWDSAHVEPQGISIFAARYLGKRPL